MSRPTLTRKQRVRLGLSPEPPEPWQAISVDAVRAAYERTERDALKISLVSTAAAAAVYGALYAFDAPRGAYFFMIVTASVAEHVITRWWISRWSMRNPERSAPR